MDAEPRQYMKDPATGLFVEGRVVCPECRTVYVAGGSCPTCGTGEFPPLRAKIEPFEAKGPPAEHGGSD